MHGVGWKLRDNLVQQDFNYSQVLAISKAFAYPSKVYSWRVRINNNRTYGGWLLLQIWRPNTGAFDLVGSTNLTYDSSRGNGYINVELPLQAQDQIVASRGDIIGVFLPSGTVSGAPFVIAGYPAHSSRGDADDELADFLFFKEPSNQEPPSTLNTIDYDEHRSRLAINIRAMIGE